MQENLPKSIELVATSAGVEQYRLVDNDLTVLVHEARGIPVATAMITYRVGSRNEGLGQTGATHFLEHLMFKGTARFNRARGNAIFEVLQSVGAMVNATTWLDRTNYFELLPSEHLELAVEIEADRMRGALLDDDDLESERTVILNEFDRNDNNPLRKLHQLVWSAAFIAHPYRHPTIGWRHDIESMSSDDLRGYYDTFYWPVNATLSLIGDVDRTAALELAVRHFGSIGRPGTAISAPRVLEPEQQGERRVVLRMPGQTGGVLVAFKAPEGMHTDSDALDLLTTILSRGKNSRLYRSLTDRGMVSSVQASVSSLRDPGLMTVFALPAHGADLTAIESVIVEDLERICQDGVEEEELQRAKSKLRADAAYSRDGPMSIAAELNEAIATGDWKLYTTRYERLARVATSHIQDAARRYVDRDRMTVGFYIPENSKGDGTVETG